MMKNKVVKHLKSDMKSFNKEAQEDKELIRDIKAKKPMKKKVKAVKREAKEMFKATKAKANKMKSGMKYDGI